MKQYKNANYNYKSQKEPKIRLGEGNFANLPPQMILKEVPRGSMRDGIIDDFVSEMPRVSGIHENEC